jgi:hypothetical protein
VRLASVDEQLTLRCGSVRGRRRGSGCESGGRRSAFLPTACRPSGSQRLRPAPATHLRRVDLEAKSSQTPRLRAPQGRPSLRKRLNSGRRHNALIGQAGTAQSLLSQTRAEGRAAPLPALTQASPRQCGDCIGTLRLTEAWNITPERQTLSWARVGERHPPSPHPTHIYQGTCLDTRRIPEHSYLFWR